jgi:hypothetical protein
VSSIVPRDGRVGAVDTPAVARSRIDAARRRVEDALSGLERDAPLTMHWRATVKAHPVLAVSSAFLVGWAVARLLTRKRKD